MVPGKDSGEVVLMTEEPSKPSEYRCCDDCLLSQPPDPNQKYPERTYQMESDGGTMLTEDES